jgi:hypothetical protein
MDCQTHFGHSLESDTTLHYRVVGHTHTDEQLDVGGDDFFGGFWLRGGGRGGDVLVVAHLDLISLVFGFRSSALKRGMQMPNASWRRWGVASARGGGSPTLGAQRQRRGKGGGLHKRSAEAWGDPLRARGAKLPLGHVGRGVAGKGTAPLRWVSEDVHLRPEPGRSLPPSCAVWKDQRFEMRQLFPSIRTD